MPFSIFHRTGCAGCKNDESRTKPLECGSVDMWPLCTCIVGCAILQKVHRDTWGNSADILDRFIMTHMTIPVCVIVGVVKRGSSQQEHISESPFIQFFQDLH